MRNIGYASVMALVALSAPPSEAQQTAANIANGETVEVRLSNFAFAPARLQLKANVPVHLRLVNESSGGHDFSAPSFFATTTFPPAVPAPRDGEVAVPSHQTVEITVIPHAPGTYRLECTHFLHSLFGMHGTIEVVP
jgi:plastocyanin